MKEELIRLFDRWDHSRPQEHETLALQFLSYIETVIANSNLHSIESHLLLDYLNKTRKTTFLKALKKPAERTRWADTCFALIRHTGYSLNDMMQQRVNEHPDKTLFQDRSEGIIINHSYAQVYHGLKEIAAVFHASVPKEARLAIWLQTGIRAAYTDLACLMFDIFNTPLSIHFDKAILSYIFNKLNINMVVCDSKERLDIVKQIAEESQHPIKIFCTIREFTEKNKVFHLETECKSITNKEVETILLNRPRIPLNAVATTMFTSGSTGMPKGVSFSIYNIVSKRFARAAAVPEIGENEVFLCYLPLFHTFGRYLELTGSIFWGATYTAVGNSSRESLLSLFPVVNPSVFISIPLRWLELYEACMGITESLSDEKSKKQAVRNIIGARLKWGLSAAGYLPPKVFRYFQNMGVALCSGFGMTEATGGITMTPPDRYIENSTGIPLPGVKTRLNILGELEISGHYIARYLDDAGPGDIIPYPENDSNDNWLSTGDVFTIDSDGFHEIVDRVKDIYKNNKGQTVAPRTVEQKFVNVPGINATFLVGDGRPYNVLLIVPDFNDPILAALDDENRNEYFHQIVMAANNQLAPYERVINFTLLDRAFSAEMGELTPKNSYNRKAIEQNFAELIRQLYRSDIIRLEVNNMIVQIPRWFYRDLGILEDDILPIENGLRNKRNATELKIERKTDSIFLIGNLRYFNDSDVIDLGLLARQPRIWIGNPELMKFCPIKEGWDVPLKPGHDRVMIDNEQQISIDALEVINIKGSRDIQLNLVNKLVCETLFSSPSKAKTHLLKLGEIFSTCDKRMADTVRRRIEAMAYHKSESLRVTAYRVLLLNDPDPDFSKSFPAFIRSGLPFLNEASIKLIAESNLGRKHLDALRRRLYAYRIRFDETVDQPYRNQFIDLLKLLFNYARINLNYYSVIRSELANWVLFKKDKVISDRARFYIYELEKVYDQQLIKENAFNSVKEWKQKIVFENVIAKKEQEKLLQIFSSTFIVNKSIKLIYNENRFTFDEISEKGLWVVKMPVFKEYMHYRLSINTVSGKHFDIHLVKTETAKRMTTPETVFWHAAIAGHPYGEFVLPQLGCSNDNLGILTTQYISGLTLWDKIREFSEVNESIIPANKSRIWRKKFIMAFTAIIKAWKTSGYSIIPGSIAPNNSVVPETDFRDQSVILSLSGFKSYKNTISLLEPMIHNFYLKTAALYPRTKRLLQTEWIFDSFMEALGEDEAGKRFIQMKTDLRNHKIETLDGNDPVILLDKYIELRKQSRYYPIAVYNAVDRYAEWLALNPRAKVSSKEQTIFELIELFQLQKHPAIIRFYLYRYTYFSNAEPDIINTFDRLLQKMEQNTATPPVHLIELSDLQSALTNKDDKSVFAGMVFPTIRNEQKMDILRVTGKNKDAVIVRSVLTDKHQVTYKFRNPISASEVGSLYNLFFKENYPKEISDADRHIVLVDIHDRIIGGLCYKNLDEGMVLLDGIVVISSLQGRGLGSLMMEDFFTRMESSGAKIVKAHFLLGNFYLKHHFKVDEHRGALVREI